MVFIFILLRSNQKNYIMCYWYLTYNNPLLFVVFFIKLSWNFIFLHKYWICDFFVFSNAIFEVVKWFHKIRFWSTTTIADTLLPLPQHIKHWKKDQYRGSVNCGEVDLDSVINCPASENIRQSTTVPSQCDRLPYPWPYRIIYFDCWYHFE